MKTYFIIKKFHKGGSWIYFTGGKIDSDAVTLSRFTDDINKSALYGSADGAESIIKHLAKIYKGHVFSVEKIFINN